MRKRIIKYTKEKNQFLKKIQILIQKKKTNPFFKDINQEHNNSSPKKEIELSSKGSSNSPNIQNKKKSRTLYKYNKYNEKNVEELILETKRKLSRLTKKTYYDKSKINLTPQQKQFKVNIIKRNYNNNIYLNNIDQSISFVIPYKYKCSIYMFLLLGIPYIITNFSNRKLIEWRGEPCRVKDAKLYLIVDGYGNYHIRNFTKNYFNTNFNAENRLKWFDKKYISTLFSNMELSDQQEYHEIIYVYNKYYCYRKVENINNSYDTIKRNLNETFTTMKTSSVDFTNEKINNKISKDYINQNIFYNQEYYFESPVFNLACTSNKNIYNIFSNYFLKPKEINFQLNIYGQNKLVLRSINYITIIIQKLINAVTLYVLAIIIFFWYEKYNFFFFILILSIIIIIISTYQKYLNKKKSCGFFFE